AASGTLALQAYAEEGEEVELVLNGSFDDGLNGGWWSTGNVTMDVVNGQLCAQIPGGTVNPWDAIIGQNDIPITAGGGYSFSFEASGDPGGQVRGVIGLAVEPFDTYFAVSSPLTPSTVELGQGFTATATTTDGQVAFQVGGSADPWTFCVDNVSLI